MGLFNILKSFADMPKVFEVGKKEEVAFQNMMLTPNNETVSVYIEVLKNRMEVLNNFAGAQSVTTGMHMKYVNAYKVVKKSDIVSDELKAELGRYFLAMGVAISID